MSVPPRRINEIVHGIRTISADSALRLARFFGTSPEFWLSLRARYDLTVEKDRLGRRIESEVEVFAADDRLLLAGRTPQPVRMLRGFLKGIDTAVLRDVNVAERQVSAGKGRSQEAVAKSLRSRQAR